MLNIRDKKSGELLKPLGLAEDPLYNQLNYKAVYHFFGGHWTNGVVWFTVEGKNILKVSLEEIELINNNHIPLIVSDTRYGIWPNPYNFSDEFYQFGPRLVARINGTPDKQPELCFNLYNRISINDKTINTVQLLKSYKLIKM